MDPQDGLGAEASATEMALPGQACGLEHGSHVGQESSIVTRAVVVQQGSVGGSPMRADAATSGEAFNRIVLVGHLINFQNGTETKGYLHLKALTWSSQKTAGKYEKAAFQAQETAS